MNTKFVHAGQTPDATGSVTVPIYQTSTFAFRSAAHGAALFAEQEAGFVYTRMGNPTVKALEDNITALENGCAAVATSSGMAAVATVMIALLDSGDHVVCTASVYGTTRVLLDRDLSRFGVQASFVDTSDLEQVRQALRPRTRLILIESPSNPAMQVSDIAAIARIAHQAGCLLAVDNTFASPYLQKPLDLGADISLHSITKFINGHADVIGGILVSREPAVAKRLRQTMGSLGCNMDPHQAFLVLRGVKTLGIRVERAQQNAMQIARWLEAHPAVSSVRYIGLESHPQHELACRQMSGFGAMISFELHGGLEAGIKLMDRVKLAALAVSLGGVETLIQHPASMTHSRVPVEARHQAGISDGLVRYAVGIEDVEDLIADLQQAMEGLAEPVADVPELAGARG